MITNKSAMIKPIWLESDNFKAKKARTKLRVSGVNDPYLHINRPEEIDELIALLNALKEQMVE